MKTICCISVQSAVGTMSVLKSYVKKNKNIVLHQLLPLKENHTTANFSILEFIDLTVVTLIAF